MPTLRLNYLPTVALISLVLLSAPALAEDWSKLSMDPGATINDLYMLDDGVHGWAVGSLSAGGESMAVLLRTVDGDTWESSEAEFTHLPNGVYFASSDIGWVVCSRGRIYRTDDGGLTWAAQTSGTYRTLSKVIFLNENEGWATGGWQDGSSYLVLHTTNGGVSWEDQSFGNTCYSCGDIFFTDPLNGWVCGYDNALDGHIHHTSDGGLNWVRQTIPDVGGQVSSLAFTDAETGWATSSSIYASPTGAILYTQDGGNTWTIQGYTNIDYNYAIDCQDDQHVAITSYQVLGPSQQKLVFTTDGGTTWNSRTVPMLSYSNAIQYVNDVVRLTGSSSRIMRTDDLGDTWSWDSYAPTWNGVGWRDGQTGWLVTVSYGGTDGYAYRTDDGGSTWQRDFGVPGGSQILFVDALHGWMLMSKSNGLLWRTVDGGDTWTQHYIGTGNWADEVFFVNESRGWACGSGGMIRRTDDGGETWTSQSSGTSYYVAVLFFLNKNEGWAAGGYGAGNGFIRHTTNGGDTWDYQPPASSGHHQAGFFIDNQLGWLVDYGGRVHRTTSGGESWQIIGYVPHTYVYDLFMQDESTGWLLVGNASGGASGEDGRGFIYKTEDGGVSWTEEWAAPYVRGTLYDLTQHPTSGSLWVCGAHNTLLLNGDLAAVDGDDLAANAFTFHPAAPNPIAAQTRFSYELAEPGWVKLAVYDVQGRLMRTLVDGRQTATRHEIVWNGEGEGGRRLPGDIYFVRLLTERGSQTRRILLR